jgi:hypothetical protein
VKIVVYTEMVDQIRIVSGNYYILVQSSVL